MNPDRDDPAKWWHRPSQSDEISEERMTETMEMLQRVADNTNTELDQVINVYSSAVRNRLTEVLLDSGDAFDSIVDDIREWHKKNEYIKLKIAGDYTCDEVKVKMVSNN